MRRRRRLWSSALAAARPVAGVALAPLAFGVLLGAVRSLGGLGAGRSTVVFCAGLAGYAALHLSGLLRLRPAYVFAHESCHALAAWLCGGRVLRFVVRAESGHVDLSKSNAFIALAPYWVPFYALAAAAAYRVMLFFADPPYARDAFLAATGAALAFHLLHTAESLWVARQHDLDEAGRVLSLALIFLLNGAVLLAAAKALFPASVSVPAALRWAWDFQVGVWAMVGEGVRRFDAVTINR